MAGVTVGGYVGVGWKAHLMPLNPWLPSGSLEDCFPPYLKDPQTVGIQGLRLSGSLRSTWLYSEHHEVLI